MTGELKPIWCIVSLIIVLTYSPAVLARINSTEVNIKAVVPDKPVVVSSNDKSVSAVNTEEKYLGPDISGYVSSGVGVHFTNALYKYMSGYMIDNNYSYGLAYDWCEEPTYGGYSIQILYEKERWQCIWIDPDNFSYKVLYDQRVTEIQKRLIRRFYEEIYWSRNLFCGSSNYIFSGVL